MMRPVAGNPPEAADQVDYTVAGAIDVLMRGLFSKTTSIKIDMSAIHLKVPP